MVLCYCGIFFLFFFPFGGNAHAKKQEMKHKIEQGFLFPEAKKAPLAIPQKAYRAPPNLTLAGGLNDAAVKADSVYWLRILAGQCVRALPHQKAKKELLETVGGEISLKQGRLPPELVVKNMLMKKGLKL